MFRFGVRSHLYGLKVSTGFVGQHMLAEDVQMNKFRELAFLSTVARTLTRAPALQAQNRTATDASP